ncbi:MAG: hypothetical protein QW719_03050, partial [Candidatus Micrarchaeaceae archaeon]
MQKLSLLLMPIMLMLLLVGVSEATAPSAIPANIVDYVQLNLSTSWSSVKSAYVQQMVNITESTYSSYLAYNNNFANFEFFYSNGTVIPAWIESNSSGKIITWVKIKNTTTSFYLGFASKSTNLLSSSCTSGIGEAPQLSSTYAEYDDGPYVFPNYWNFAGATLPSGLSYINSTSFITINNGATVTQPVSNSGYAWIYTTSALPSGEIMETSQITSSSEVNTRLAWSTTTSLSTSAYGQYTPYNSYANNINPPDLNGVVTTSSATTGVTVSPTIPITMNGIFSFAWLATGSQWYAFNYQTATSTDTTAAITSTLYGFYGVGEYNYATGTVDTQTIYWLRTRAYPPSGVMPSVSFGAVQGYPTLTIIPNPAVYGQSITITATCPVSTDTCAIDYPSLGTAIATGTGTATYTYPANALSIGTYNSYYAVDTSTGLNSTPQSITVFAYKLVSAKVNATAYETSTQGYDYELNVSSLVGNVILQENGAAIASLTPKTPLPSTQWFNFTYAIPLLAVNNTAVSFNAVVDVSNTLTTVNSTTQHLLQNYFTSGGPKYNPILTGSGETFFINITQVKPLNTASVLNATLTVGNQTVPLQTVLPYKYYFQYSSFVPSLYGLANPAGKTPTAYTTKGTIKLGFDGSSVYRNLTLNPLTIYNPYLVACNSTTPKAFSWSFYNASNLKQITTNTLISGYFVPKKGLYTGNTINGTAA